MELNSRRDRRHETLDRPRPADLESLLVGLVNTPLDQARVRRLQTITKENWPDLWGWPDDESEVRGVDRALELLKKIRTYLQQAWTSRDPDARDWFLLRARTWHYLHLIQPKTKEQRQALEAAVKPDVTGDQAIALRRELDWVIDNALDQPPPRTGFSEMLTHFQHIAHKLRYCPADGCQQPYFIANRKGQEYCGAPECVNYGQRKAKKKWWRENRQAAKKRRKQQ